MAILDAVNNPLIARSWVRSLAEPYLREYRAAPARSGSLRGYWFFHPASAVIRGEGKVSGLLPAIGPAAGFFLGYLAFEEGFEFLSPAPPECLVFAFAAPVESELHQLLVGEKGRLFRQTFDYIRLLTHRPPRFVFHENQIAALARHQSMREWPRQKYDHLSRNFFIETLAWLVRSALVRKILVEELGLPGAAKSHGPKVARETIKAAAV